MERSETTRVLSPHSAAPGAGGLVLDRYRLERRLGAGGFGVVWLAFDEKLERPVAVKEVRRDPDDPMPVRVLREARVAARLNHPGIVGLYELGSDDHAVYLVSELVRGRTFGELLRGGALSDRDVARIGAALCDALAHAHARDVIHRDVKPQNVMVVAEPAAGAGFAKLTDFGVAHLADGDTLTRTGDVVGTLAYMAPEQAEGRPAGPECDVYSMALTLYEGWTGPPTGGRRFTSSARSSPPLRTASPTRAALSSPGRSSASGSPARRCSRTTSHGCPGGWPARAPAWPPARWVSRESRCSVPSRPSPRSLPRRSRRP